METAATVLLWMVVSGVALGALLILGIIITALWDEFRR